MTFTVQLIVNLHALSSNCALCNTGMASNDKVSANATEDQ